MRHPGRSAIAGAALLAFAGLGGSSSSAGAGPKARQIHLSAGMTPRQVVTPAGKPFAVPAVLGRARGAFSATISADRKMLTWRLTYSHIANPALVLADIQIGKPGTFGPFMLRLCGPCRSGQHGTAPLRPGFGHDLITGHHWLALDTNVYPNGAVRGQIEIS